MKKDKVKNLAEFRRWVKIRLGKVDRLPPELKDTVEQICRRCTGRTNSKCEYRRKCGR